MAPVIGLDARFLFSRPMSPHAHLFRQVLMDNARSTHPFSYRLFTDEREPVLGDLGAPNVTLKYVGSPGRAARDLLWVHVFLARELLRNPVDLFVSCYYKVPVLAGVPCVNMVHDTSFFRLPLQYLSGRQRVGWYRLLLRPLMRFHCARALATITVSEHSKRCLIENLKLAPDRLHVIYNPVDPHFYRARNKVPNSQRKYFLFIGSDIPKKRLTLTVLAYAHIPAELRDSYPLVLRTTLESRRLKELKEQGRPGNVKIISEPLSQMGLVRLIQHAWCVILLSADEGFGLPIAEAMAVGTPVLISTDGGALTEIVGEGGAQAEGRAVDDIAREWARIILDTRLRERMVSAAAAKAEAFRPERIATHFVAVISDLLREQRPSPGVA
jgi:glycosyltransferase involved in cell wall biosynthesis